MFCHELFNSSRDKFIPRRNRPCKLPQKKVLILEEFPNSISKNITSIKIPFRFYLRIVTNGFINVLQEFELDVLEEAYTTEHWLVRIYKVKDLDNRGS